MQSARRREREFFQTSPDYAHLASRMGTEYLAKMVSKHLEEVIKSRIPGITVGGWVGWWHVGEQG